MRLSAALIFEDTVVEAINQKGCLLEDDEEKKRKEWKGNEKAVLDMKSMQERVGPKRKGTGVADR